MKNIIIAVIAAVALVTSSFVIKTGMSAQGGSHVENFSLYGYEGVLYRLNNANGRIDVLVPSNEAAILFPVGQIQLPASDKNLTEQEKTSFSTNLKTLSQYIQGERGRSLGLKIENKPVVQAVTKE